MEPDDTPSQPARARSAAPRGRPSRALTLGVVLLAALLALPLAAVVTASTNASQAEYWGVTRVELSLGASGDVEVVGADTDRVEVARTVRGLLGSTAMVDERQDDGTLRLRTRCPLPVVAFACGRVTHTLRVPTGTVIEGSTSNGSIRLAGVDGLVNLSTSNGAVTVEGGASPITLRTSNGNIEVGHTRAPRVDVETSNGDITVASEVAPEAVTARSSNGRIGVFVPSDAPPYAVDSRTSNGRTDITVATDPSASRTIDARTSNGNITVGNAAPEHTSRDASRPEQ